MTYNIRRCLGMDRHHNHKRVAEVIRLANPDVVALQEVDKNQEKSGHVDQPARIAEALGMTAHFTSRLKTEKGDYGLAFLSRLPLTVVKEDEISPNVLNRFKEKTMAQWVSVHVDGQRVDIINTHLLHSLRLRLLLVKKLLGPHWVGGHKTKTPLLFCGDLNTQIFSYVYRRLACHLTPTSSDWDSLFLTTWPSPVPFVKIDHAFYTTGLSVKKTFVPTHALARQASDHFPYVVDFDINEAAS